MQDARHRRWFRFSLRAFIVAVTLVGIWLGWNLRQVCQRDLVLARQNIVPVYVGSPTVTSHPRRTSPGRFPLTWSLLGASPVHKLICTGGFESAEDVNRVSALFPEAELQVMQSFGAAPRRRR